MRQKMLHSPLLLALRYPLHLSKFWQLFLPWPQLSALASQPSICYWFAIFKTASSARTGFWFHRRLLIGLSQWAGRGDAGVGLLQKCPPGTKHPTSMNPQGIPPNHALLLLLSCQKRKAVEDPLRLVFTATPASTFTSIVTGSSLLNNVCAFVACFCQSTW